MPMRAVICFVVFAGAAAAAAAAETSMKSPANTTLQDQHPLQCDHYSWHDNSVSESCNCEDDCCPSRGFGGCACSGSFCGCSQRSAYGVRSDNCPEPPPTPAPPSPSSSYDLIDEFNDPGVGIAFTVIPENVWEGHGGGNNGMDAAGFFSLNDMYTYHANSQQAVSIVTRVQDMTPYDGGYGTWGLAFHVTENHEFWKYFQVAMYGKNVLVAGPGDGANHIPGTSDWRHTIVQEGKSYEWFKNQKNGILERYNTVYHNHDYNEFDTNGLAPDGLAGVFVNEQYNKPGPSHQSMCNFLMRANPSKSSWPVYGYKWHNLYIKEVLNCANTVVV